MVMNYENFILHIEQLMLFLVTYYRSLSFVLHTLFVRSVKRRQIASLTYYNAGTPFMIIA
jgi:hypothetical protein